LLLRPEKKSSSRLSGGCAAANLLVLNSEFVVMPGVMCSCLAGSRTWKGYSAILVAAIISPPGSMNSLLEVLPVRRHGSSDVPTPKVQPLSTTVDGMVPSMMPRRSMSSLSPMTYHLGDGGSSCVFARIWRDAWRFANLRAHRCAILLAMSVGTVGSTSMVGLNVTVGLGGVLFLCSST
jgi:hypothetical protein